MSATCKEQFSAGQRFYTDQGGVDIMVMNASDVQEAPEYSLGCFVLQLARGIKTRKSKTGFCERCLSTYSVSLRKRD